MSKTISLGNKGEDLVALYLQQMGFSVTERNYSCKFGEIDIIAVKDDIVAFIEVKLRTNPLFNISQVIVPTKQRKIINTARWYILKNNIYERILRFDVALVCYDGKNEHRIEYLENAFSPTE